MSLAAAAQDVRPSLLDEEVLPTNLADDEQVSSKLITSLDQDPGTKATERQQEVQVVAGVMKEEYLVGPYKQAEWTQHRRFGTTRIYIQQPPGAVEFEQWLEIRIPKQGGKNTEIRMREELEFGLGGRFQLDVYLHTIYEIDRKKVENTLDWRGISYELRWALADWNEIWGNPTLYFEYFMPNGAADTVEGKILFGGEIAPRWHWGFNIVYERELAIQSERTEEIKGTLGLSYSLIDTKLGVGLSMEASYEAEYEGGVAGRSREVLAGPSFQYRPIPKAHLNFEPMWGLTGESKRAKIFIIFGWDF
jgi:hypothetical protein